MSYAKICGNSTVTVADYKDLTEWWRQSKPSGIPLYVGKVVVLKALTEAQLDRLCGELRRKIQIPDDSVAFLEVMWCLPDTRG